MTVGSLELAMTCRIAICSLATVIYLGAVAWYADRVPDLPIARAAELIIKAPEFNRYARLVKVDGLYHEKASMKRRSDGSFAFQYLNARADALPIRANVHFAYWRGAWHLGAFDYGCPSNCHFVDVYNEPVDDSHPLRDMLLFRPN